MDDRLYFGTCDKCGYFGEIYAVEVASPYPGINLRKYLCSKCENEFHSKKEE